MDEKYIVCLIALFLIMFYLMNNANNKDNESQQESDTNYLSNLLQSYPGNTNKSVKEDVLGVNVNYSQKLMYDLVKTLEIISNNKQMHLDKCVERIYTKATINAFLDIDLKDITSLILKRISDKSIFNFSITNFEKVSIFTKGKVAEFFIDVFVQEVRMKTDYRLMINVVVMKDNDSKVIDGTDRSLLPTCTSVTTPEFKEYDIGIPSEDQLIPLPTQVITTSLEVLSDAGTSPIEPIKIKSIHINSVKIFNSNLILDPLCVISENNVNGVIESDIDSSLYEGINNPYEEKSIIRNKWPTLLSQPKGLNSYPCMPISDKWNDLGLYEPPAFPTKNCPGIKYAVTKQPVTAQYWPTLATVPRNSGDNAWLFNLSKGIPSFPTGSSNS